MIHKPATLTIKRSEWARKTQDNRFPNGPVFLKNSFNGYSAVGLYALASGVLEHDFENRLFLCHCLPLQTVDVLFPKDMENRLEIVGNRSISGYIDWSGITNTQQEQLIAAGFALIGVKVEFED